MPLAITRSTAFRVLLFLMAIMVAYGPSTATFAQAQVDGAAPELEETSATEAPAPDTEVTDSAADTAAVTATAQDATTTTAPVEEAAVTASADTTAAAARRDDQGGGGPYTPDPTASPTPSGNGNGGGGGNRPCAGCVGKADGKNPPGQLPGAEDDGNSGYECDGNSGASRGNPAHTQCPVPVPAIDLTKRGPSTATIGQTITYTFTVTNTGNETLNNVSITDPLIGTGQIAVTPSTLAAKGGTGTATAQYTVKAGDVTGDDPNRRVPNTATVRGTGSRSGTTVTDTASWVVNIPPPGTPAIALTKTCPQRAQIGERITYSFTVRNTGGVTLTNVHITDPLIGGGQIAVTPSTLAAGATGTATAPYTVRAQDVVNGQVPNTATVRGTSPTNATATATSSCNVMIDGPAITLTKSGPTVTRIGDRITYSFSVRNTGNVTLTNVHITDPLIGTGQIAVTPSTLAPDGTGTATAQYTVRQQDVVNNQIPNTATVRGTPPAGDPVTAVASWTVNLEIGTPGPAIELTKRGPNESRVGDVITYTFSVRNSGKVTLTNVYITDPLIGTGQIAVTPSTLAPDDTGTATAQYTVREQDVRGVDPDRQVPNTATVSGTAPSGATVTDIDSWRVKIPTIFIPNPGIRIVKDGPRTARQGDLVTYTFTVTNTGNVNLTNVSVTDAKLGISNLPVSPSTLTPGQSGRATATYTVTAADARRGVIRNTAIARGTPPDGSFITDDDDHDIDTCPTSPGFAACIPSDPPSILLEKTGPATARVGDLITYRFRVTNNGDQTLTDVNIDDKRLGITNLPVSPSTLEAGQSGTASATYTVTEADGTLGRIKNTAITTGTTPRGSSVEDEDDHITTVRIPPPPCELGDPDCPPVRVPCPRGEPRCDLPATGSNAPTQLVTAMALLMLGAIMLSRSEKRALEMAIGTPRRLAGHESPPPVHRRR